MTPAASRTSSTASAMSSRTLVSTARREGFMSVKQFSGALAQLPAPGIGEFIHQGTMFLNHQRAGGFLFNVFLQGFHVFSSSFRNDFRPTHAHNLISMR